MYPDHEIKIIDQNLYDSMKDKENTVFIGKTDDFGAHLKEWKKLDELQVAKYKNVKAEELGSTYQMYNQSHRMPVDSCLWASSLELRTLSNDGKLLNV